MTRDSERQLWCAVIQTALDDAQGRVAGSKGEHPEIAIASARAWLTRPNRDFNSVCYLAGLDPVAVRERATKLLVQHHAA